MIASTGEALETEELRWRSREWRTPASNSGKSADSANPEAGYVTIHVTKSRISAYRWGSGRHVEEADLRAGPRWSDEVDPCSPSRRGQARAGLAETPPYKATPKQRPIRAK